MPFPCAAALHGEPTTRVWRSGYKGQGALTTAPPSAPQEHEAQLEGSKPPAATPDGPSPNSPSSNAADDLLWPNVSSGDVRALASAASVLQLSPAQPTIPGAPYTGHRVTWFPEYGCALVGLGQPDRSSAGCKARGAPSAGGADGETVEAVEEEEQQQEAGKGLASCVRPCPDSLSLHLVALDGWGFTVHGSRKMTKENG